MACQPVVVGLDQPLRSQDGKLIPWCHHSKLAWVLSLSNQRPENDAQSGIQHIDQQHGARTNAGL